MYIPSSRTLGSHSYPHSFSFFLWLAREGGKDGSVTELTGLDGNWTLWYWDRSSLEKERIRITHTHTHTHLVDDFTPRSTPGRKLLFYFCCSSPSGGVNSRRSYNTHRTKYNTICLLLSLPTTHLLLFQVPIYQEQFWHHHSK